MTEPYTETTTALPWYQLLHEYYHVHMPKGRPETWFKLMREKTQQGGCGAYTTEAEIAAAIMWIRSERQANREDEDIKVDLNKLIIWIRKYRKDHRKAEENGNEPADCAMCHDGWLTVWPSLPENPGFWDFGPRADQKEVPCLCSKGQRLFFVVKDYKNLSQDERQDLIELAKLAMRQTGEMREIQKREVAELLNAPPDWEPEET